MLGRPVFCVALTISLLPSLALAANFRKATSDERQAAYCLAYLKASGPTPEQLNDISIKDGATQAILAQRQAVIAQFDAYLKPRLSALAPSEMEAESKRANDDAAYVVAPRSVDPDKVFSDPVVKRVLSCETFSPPK